MRARWPLLLALSILAGCLAQEPAPPMPAETPAAGVVIDADRPDTQFGEVVTGPAVGPDVNATLDAAPRLIAGEWWRLRFASPFDGEQVEVVRVVAEVMPDSDACDASSRQAGACGGYVIGMPHEGWYKEVISYHSPALGDVGFDLSYATHNEIFQPLKFPLKEGESWETIFATSPFVATVESVEGVKATIKLTPAGEPTPLDPVYAAIGFTSAPMTLTYDASLHEVAHFDSGIGTYEIVEHGYGYEGWVTIPRGEHTAIDYGQLGPVTPGDDVVTRSIEVAGGYNRLTLMHAVFPIGPGAYRVRAVAPDGTEFVTESIGGEPAIRFYEAADPDGTWTTEDVVAGPGGTYSMGIAYHQYDIRLPDGLKRSDHSHEVVR